MNWFRVGFILCMLIACAWLSATDIYLFVSNVYYDQGDVDVTVYPSSGIPGYWEFDNGIYCCGTKLYVLAAMGGQNNTFLVEQGGRSVMTTEYIGNHPGTVWIYMTLPADPNHVHRDNM